MITYTIPEGMNYTMPAEETEHEGTWLQWPHNYTYKGHTSRHDKTFVAITKALHTAENVHIIVYNEQEKNRVIALLKADSVNMGTIDFYIWKTDDYWVRDNGPIFVYDENDKLKIQNWGFNGWGNKTPYKNCNTIPTQVGQALGIESVDIGIINEGGSVEIDGHGTLLAKRSSILNQNRNPNLSQEKAEEYFKKYLGITNFIWLEGLKGEDITDDHIDGTARFANSTTIVTVKRGTEYADPTEFEILSNAKNSEGKKYTIVELPLTQNRLPKSKEYGIYINFYIGNKVVLVPNFNDPNDAIANAILQKLYPNRKVIGIPSTELGEDGGGVHCVTQQQPLAHP